VVARREPGSRGRRDAELRDPEIAEGSLKVQVLSVQNFHPRGSFNI
jgi:hypothetical protein